jgi:hypothetical protein
MSTLQEGKTSVPLLLKESANKFLSVVEKKFQIKLDFSESSLYIADFLITLFFKERRVSNLAVSLIGSYLGEVILQNLGGKWNTEDFSITKIGKMKGTAYPFRQAKNRLQKGLGYACTSWYADLKMRFCQDGELSWNGQHHNHASVYQQLVAQGWDLRVLGRILDENEKPYVREEAAHVLRELKSPRVASSLLEALNTPEHAYFACIAFQGIRDPAALPNLRSLSMPGREIAVRIQAIQALGEQKDEASIEMLGMFFKEDEEIIAHYASQALAKIGGEKAIQILLDAMKNGNSTRKILALSAFELLGDRVCIPSLIENLYDPDDEVREAATRLLQFIQDERAFGPLMFLLNDRSSRIRILAAYALTFLQDKKALPAMKKLLKDPVKEVRDHAAYLIPLLENGEKPAGFCW